MLTFFLWGVLHIEDMLCIFTLPKTFTGQMALCQYFLPAKVALCPALQLFFHSLQESAVPREPFLKRFAVESKACALPDPIHFKLQSSE